jgi:hypothetical protein
MWKALLVTVCIGLPVARCGKFPLFSCILKVLKESKKTVGIDEANPAKDRRNVT